MHNSYLIPFCGIGVAWLLAGHGSGLVVSVLVPCTYRLACTTFGATTFEVWRLLRLESVLI